MLLLNRVKEETAVRTVWKLFKKAAQDETLWRSFTAGVNHLANILKAKQVGVTLQQRHRHAAPMSNTLLNNWTVINCLRRAFVKQDIINKQLLIGAVRLINKQSVEGVTGKWCASEKGNCYFFLPPTIIRSVMCTRGYQYNSSVYIHILIYTLMHICGQLGKQGARMLQSWQHKWN